MSSGRVDLRPTVLLDLNLFAVVRHHRVLTSILLFGRQTSVESDAAAIRGTSCCTEQILKSYYSSLQPVKCHAQTWPFDHSVGGGGVSKMHVWLSIYSRKQLKEGQVRPPGLDVNHTVNVFIRDLVKERKVISSNLTHFLLRIGLRVSIWGLTSHPISSVKGGPQNFN